MAGNGPVFLGADGGEEFWTEERCYITELFNDAAVPGASLALARVEPGVTTQLHALEGVTETYVVRKGGGVVEVAGVTRRLGPSDKVVIPAGAPQRITNDGDGDLEFYCLCVPRFRSGCYRGLEGRTPAPPSP